MINETENNILCEISNYLGIKYLNKDAFKRDIGSMENYEYINTSFDLDVSDLIQADLISSIFARVHRSQSVHDAMFIPSFEEELKSAGVPTLEIEKAAKIATKIAKKESKEGSENDRDQADVHMEFDDLADFEDVDQSKHQAKNGKNRI